jgi:hypothetical protein
MMRHFNFKKHLALVALVCVAATSMAQDNNNRGGDRGPGGQGGDRGRWDPAQFQERMMEHTRERLEVKDDAEWKALQPLVKKVMDARMSQFSGMGRGGSRGPDNNSGNNSGRPANPEVDALNRAIEGKASNAELKAAVARVQEARKVKQAELEKAQAALRQVLSVRQEALATANGLL